MLFNNGKKYYILILFICLIGLNVFGQTDSKINIQHLEIKDTFLVKEVEKLILEEVNREVVATNDKVFTENFFKKGLGYITLRIYGNLHGDTICKYYISPKLLTFNEQHPDNIYPPFYTYIGGRLILIYLSELEVAANITYSKKSKKMLRKKVDQFLEKPKDVVFYDMKGKKTFRDKNMRIDYFQFHNGKSIYILKSGPPIIVED